MPTYFVKTHANRNFVITADSFDVNYDNQDYGFIKNGKQVALIPRTGVLAVLEETAYTANDSSENEDESDEPCLHCKFVEFTESQEFFDAVADIFVEMSKPLGEPDQPEPDGTPRIYQATVKDKEEVYWGFNTPEGFVDFTERERAVNGLKMYEEGDKNWHYFPLSEVKEVTVQ